MSRTALVVGAGIGGLSAALALEQAGWRVRVFERAASPRELGFGLLVAPNAIAALRRLGVADTVIARGHAPRLAEIRRLDGTVLKRAAMPPPAVMGGPLVVALRHALHGALLDAVGFESLTFSREAIGFTAAADGVTLQLMNGESAAGDLLVGADGAGSVVRRVLHPAEPPPRDSGLIAVRGAVDGAVAHLDGLSAVYYLAPGVEAAVVRAGETGIYWYLSLARELVPDGLRDPAAIVAHLAPRLDRTFRAVTSATVDLRCDALVDRDPIPFWGRGLVTLLGDAAHPVLPHTGQGAAQAIVDAVVLAEALAVDPHVERALRSYERERRRKTAALLAQGRRTARLMRSTNPVAGWIREQAIRLVPVGPLVKVLAGLERAARR